jgi:hypothetical protein
MSGPHYPEPPDDDVDVSGIEYFDRVGSDLVASAAIAGRPRRPWARWLRPAVLTGAAAAATVIGLIGFQLVGSEPTVEAIDIRQLDDRTVITVDDLIDDPQAVEQELADAGVPAAVLGALAPPSRVGRILEVGNATAPGDEDSPQPEVEDRDDDGAVDVIVLPAGFSGSLELVLGVSSDASFGLQVDGPPAGCDDLVARPVGDVLDDLRAISSDIEWSRETADGFGQVDEADIAPTDTVTEVSVDVDGRLMVFTTDDPDRNPLAFSPCDY